jgi:hypothetical protein
VSLGEIGIRQTRPRFEERGSARPTVEAWHGGPA